MLLGSEGTATGDQTTGSRKGSCPESRARTGPVCELHFFSAEIGWLPEASSEPNKFILKQHFKMEGVQMVRDLLRKDDYMVSVKGRGGNVVIQEVIVFFRA